MEGRLLYKPKECAALLGVSKSWLYSEMRAGTIPVVELAQRCLRIPADALGRLLQSKLKDPEAWS